MIPYVRRQEILNEVKKKGIVYLEDLSETFSNISVTTIRRDLKQLEDEGHVDVLRGGAAKLRSTGIDIPINTKEKLYRNEKEKIAAYAASLVDAGDIIYLDSGSTTLLMVKHLAQKQITVVTSNTQVLGLLHECDFKCIFLGGNVNPALGSVSGSLTEKQLSELFFHKAFLGATSYSAEAGISTPDPDEGVKKQLVAQNSKETYVLMDASKANKQSFYKSLEFDQCVIITDQSNELLEKNANFVVASERNLSHSS